MAEVLLDRHAARGQEGQLDTQDQPVVGSSSEWQDPSNAYAHPGSPA